MTRANAKAKRRTSTAPNFKFRAEFQKDADSFKSAFQECGTEIGFWRVKNNEFGEPTITFRLKNSSLGLQELVDIASAIDDGHVIVETLQRKTDYTGKRTYPNPSPAVVWDWKQQIPFAEVNIILHDMGANIRLQEVETECDAFGVRVLRVPQQNGV
jgi:hypothetical protein